MNFDEYSCAIASIDEEPPVEGERIVLLLR
jgi:hypothetical protein